MSATRLSVVVGGVLASNSSQGGLTWIVLHYVEGLRRLGHQVHVIEPVPADRLGSADLRSSEAAARFAEVVSDFGLTGSAALLLSETSDTLGLSYERLRSVCSEAELLLDISGVLAREPLTAEIPRRVYVDLDPAFTQLWQAAEGIDMGFEAYTHLATVGLSLGDATCPVPTCGRDWIPILPPVVLERWPVAGAIAHDALTTVANWRGYGSIEHAGVMYGQKAHSLRELIELPTLTDQPIELALAIHPDEEPDLAALRRNGWALLDPAVVAGTPARYHDFVQGSRAELGIAKSGYVRSRSGWFSDRSACYLASGRPVIAQDTGFSSHLPVGEGLIAFSSVDDVLAAIEELRGDYERHRRAAREIAQSHLDSDRVLSDLLEAVGGCA